MSGEPIRIPAEVQDASLYDEVAQAFESLAANGACRTLIHVNNLENLSRDDTDMAAGLIQDLRNYFLIPESHWIFVGATGIEEAIFRRTP